MEKAKISLLVLLALVVSALVFLFRYRSKEDQNIKDKMAEVRAHKGLKKYVQSENQDINEKIENLTSEKPE